MSCLCPCFCKKNNETIDKVPLLMNNSDDDDDDDTTIANVKGYDDLLESDNNETFLNLNQITKEKTTTTTTTKKKKKKKKEKKKRAKRTKKTKRKLGIKHKKPNLAELSGFSLFSQTVSSSSSSISIQTTTTSKAKTTTSNASPLPPPQLLPPPTRPRHTRALQVTANEITNASAPVASSESSSGFQTEEAANAARGFEAKPLVIVKRLDALEHNLECLSCFETTLAEESVYSEWEQQTASVIECWEQVPDGIFGVLCNCDPLKQPVHIACGSEWIRSRPKDVSADSRLCSTCGQQWVICAKLNSHSSIHSDNSVTIPTEPWRWVKPLTALERDEDFPARRFKPIPAGKSFILFVEVGASVCSLPDLADSNEADAYSHVQIRIGLLGGGGGGGEYVSPFTHQALRGKEWCEYFDRNVSAGTIGRYVPWDALPRIHQDLYDASEC